MRVKNGGWFYLKASSNSCHEILISKSYTYHSSINCFLESLKTTRSLASNDVYTESNKKGGLVEKRILDRCCHHNDRRSPVQRPVRLHEPVRYPRSFAHPRRDNATRAHIRRADRGGARIAIRRGGGNLKCAALQDKELSTNNPLVTGNQRTG